MKIIHSLMIKMLLKSKRLYLIISVLIVLGIYNALKYSGDFINQLNRVQNKDFLYYMYNDFFKVNIVLLVIIPLFLSILEFNIDIFDRYKVILKYNDIKRWWRDKNFGMFLYSFIYVTIINLVMIVNVIFSGNGEKLDSRFFIFLFTGFLLQLLGFLIFSLLYEIFTLIIKKTWIGYVLTYGIILLVYVIQQFSFQQIFSLKIRSVEYYMVLVYKFNTNRFAFNYMDLIYVLWFLLIYVILYIYGYYVCKRMDIYWSE
ncbi:ABC-2 type transport system permease protein [Thermohydrogenium kirishiense]|nr:ABC-2 type transport system permease protein [Thermohydrogenium kirishiense]